MSVGKQSVTWKLMYDYEDEIKNQIITNISRVAFPVLLPLYLMANIIDWMVAPSHGLEFLFLRLSIIPIAVLCYADLKLGWSRSWFPFNVWLFSFLISLQLVYMAFREGNPLTSTYLFTMNLVAGLFLFFFTMKFHQNMLTLLAFYAPPAIALFLTEPTDRLITPATLISFGMFITYSVAARSMDELRYRAFQQKTNLFFLATTDALSGLKLRRYFFNRFIQELSLRFRRTAEFKASVAIIDIDDFKQINDHYGHEVGDELIKHIGDIIRNSIRVYDTACRFGGEEFIILLPDTRLEEAKIVSERIREAIWSLPLLTGSSEIRSTVSIGVGGMQREIPESFEAIQRSKNYKYILIQQMLEIIKRADDSLYQAKQKGKNCVVIGERVGLLQAIDSETIESLKGYLVYFDQDVFSLPSDDVDAAYSLALEEINFYTEEYFFRRAVESIYRSYRDPAWQEILVVMQVETRDLKVARKEICKMFRVADTISMFNPGRFGLIFFGLTSENLRRVKERIESSLVKALGTSDIKVKIAAAALKYGHYHEVGPKPRMPHYRDFADRVTEILGILRRHRFGPEEDIYFYQIPNARVETKAERPGP